MVREWVVVKRGVEERRRRESATGCCETATTRVPLV
jgi:hypothetical protein